MVSAVCRPQTHLITDQIPLFVVVVLTENLHFVWRKVHCVLKQKIRFGEDKFLLMRIQLQDVGLENVTPSESSPESSCFTL